MIGTRKCLGIVGARTVARTVAEAGSRAGEAGEEATTGEPKRCWHDVGVGLQTHRTGSLALDGMPPHSPYIRAHGRDLRAHTPRARPLLVALDPKVSARRAR
jgi:hypothetical protein